MLWQVSGHGRKTRTEEHSALPPSRIHDCRRARPSRGSSDTLDTLDSRLTQAVAAADPGAVGAEAVWTQHTVAGGAGSVGALV